MRIAFLMLAIISAPAFPGDFRTLDFGAPCADVVAYEGALGSKVTKWRVEGIGVVAFEGELFGRSVVFTYFCPRGALVAGNYYLPLEDFQDAAKTYELVHRQLSAIYGAASLDNTPWMKPFVDPRWLEGNQKLYMTTWQTPRMSVTASFIHSQADEPPGWRVAIAFIGSSEVLGGGRSNTSLERTRDR